MSCPALTRVFCWVLSHGSVPNGEVAVEDSLGGTGTLAFRMRSRRPWWAFVQFMLPLAWLVMASVHRLLPLGPLTGRRMQPAILGLCVTLFLLKSAPGNWLKSAPDFKTNYSPYTGVEFIWMPPKNLFCISYSACIASFLPLREKLCAGIWACGLQGCCTTWCLWQAGEDPSGARRWVGDQRGALVKAVQVV